MVGAEDKGWLVPPDPYRKDRMSDVDRLVLKASVEFSLKEAAKRTKDVQLQRDLLTAARDMDFFYRSCEELIARHEAKGDWAEFRLLHRQLAGMAVEMAALAGRRPESPCGAFKARQLNQVLTRLKALMAEEEELGVPLSLVSETGEHSYSDVSFILRGYLDLGASYAHRHFNGKPPVIPPVPVDWTTRLVQDSILAYCMDEAKSILEIARMLNYRDKKTVRKYLNPLLDDGWLVRTVSDKPNSRNQKYLTVRFS